MTNYKNYVHMVTMPLLLLIFKFLQHKINKSFTTQ